jgi:serine/threonine-protein kinase
MELVPGVPLRQLLNSGWVGRGPFAKHVALRLASALEHAHERHIVHGDLKPENVMVAPGSRNGGRVTLIDFGLAELIPSASLPTSGPCVAGTPHYAAPERLMGKHGGFAADVFSFGVVLVELFTGTRPHRGTTREELVREILYGRPRITGARAAEPGLVRVVQRCLAKRQEARPSSSELVRVLRESIATSNARGRKRIQRSPSETDASD